MFMVYLIITILVNKNCKDYYRVIKLKANCLDLSKWSLSQTFCNEDFSIIFPQTRPNENNVHTKISKSCLSLQDCTIRISRYWLKLSHKLFSIWIKTSWPLTIIQVNISTCFQISLLNSFKYVQNRYIIKYRSTTDLWESLERPLCNINEFPCF